MTLQSRLGASFAVALFASFVSCASPGEPGVAAPQLTTEPADATVNEGVTAIFTVAASGGEPLSYSWKRNGVAIPGATSPTFSLTAAASDNGAEFSVTVSNAGGDVESREALLTVRVPPTIGVQPQDDTVEVGRAATFSTTASGTAQLAYQWRRNGSAINGATSSSYTLTAQASDADAQFAVTITNAAGFTTSRDAKLTVRIPTTVIVTTFDTALTVGTTSQASATVLDQYGAALSGSTFTWASADTTAATVSSSGLVRAVTRDTVTVIATSGGLTGRKRLRTLSPSGLYGESCEYRTEPDVITGASFQTTHPINPRYHGCLVVDTTEGHPVINGRRSLRFQVSPGDCSGNQGFDDCANDRSRHEINEVFGTEATQGQLVTYEQTFYIPAGGNFRPNGPNTLFIGQINANDASVFNTLVYLEVTSDDRLVARLHQGFTFNVASQPELATNIYGRWIQVVTEILWTSASTGRVVMTVNGVEKVRVTRPTLPSASGKGSWRLGIYNGGLSQATEARETQLMYVDRVIKTLQP